jgi:protein disulfide-isomerase-like protein
MLKSYVLTILCVLVSSKVVDINPDNWDDIVINSGKNVFIKFFAPWCGHCKKLKPDWDRLGNEYEKDSKVIIGDVDCTGSGKPLCTDVKGYPTLKSFWKSTSKDYSGSRDYKSLKEFADNLKPLCNLHDQENCTQNETDKINQFRKLSDKVLKAEYERLENNIKSEESEHENLLKSLQNKYEDSMKKLEALKKSTSFEMNLLKDMFTNKEEKEEL